jgi:hypothetical protein
MSPTLRLRLRRFASHSRSPRVCGSCDEPFHGSGHFTAHGTACCSLTCRLAQDEVEAAAGRPLPTMAPRCPVCGRQYLGAGRFCSQACFEAAWR